MAERKEITKKVRMSRDRAARLAALAKGLGKSESEILRHGIDWAEERLARRRAFDALIAMVDPDEVYEKGEIWLK